MNRINSIMLMCGGIFLLASCSQDDIMPEPQNKEKPIEFRAGVTSRADGDFDYSDASNLGTIYVTGYVGSHMVPDGQTTPPEPYFENSAFRRESGNNFTSSKNYNWPGSESTIEFFAYAPSLDDMRNAAYTQLNPNDIDAYRRDTANYNRQMTFFNMCTEDKSGSLDPVTGSSTFQGVTLSRGYKLGRFYVATNIAKQVDFITAHASGKSPKEGENVGMELNFKHQLANVELYAFSGNPKYNIEIAGVRIGRPYTGNAIFNFCSEDGKLSAADGGKWGIATNPQRLACEYIYGKDDEIQRLGTFANTQGTPQDVHNTKEFATNIMGLGGNAMVLPTKNNAWKGVQNRWISPTNPNNKGNVAPNAWSAEGDGDMYFSVLVRVTLKETGMQIYPYFNNNVMNVVYLAKNKTNNIIAGRVGKNDVVPETQEKMEFGWVSVPVSVDWKRGYKYTYYLDFTEGVGVQDPEDEWPGDPIIGSGISFTTTVAPWGTGSTGGNNTGELDVPAK